MDAALEGRKADVVLSDMAPSATGHRQTDHLRTVALAEAALDFAVAVLAPDGAFLAKVFQGGAEGEMLDMLKRTFAPCATSSHIKPSRVAGNLRAGDRLSWHARPQIAKRESRKC